MKNRIWLCLSILLAATPRVSAQRPPCRGSGFVVLQYARNRDILPKPDSRFEVWLDQDIFRGNSFEEALKRSLDAWSNAGSNWRYPFRGYTNAAYPYDGRISIVRGGPGWQFPPGVLAVSWVVNSVTTGQVIDADVLFNSGLPINTYADNKEYDFELIALHELGHSLGLGHNDHCVSSPTVMESSGPPGLLEHKLYQQEIEGVKYLYSGREAGVALSPLSLTFVGVEGDPAPAPQSVALTGPAGASWTASVNAGSWLSISAAGGGAPSALTVTVNTDNLISGLYRGWILINSAGMTQVVPVELNLAAPVLALRPRTLTFGAVRGGPEPEAQTLGLVGTVGASWTAAVEGGPWLRLASSSGRLPATVAVTVNPSGLEPGFHGGTIRVSGAGETRETAVALEVAAQSRLQLDPGEVSLSSQIGTQIAACAPVRIGSFGNVPLDWRAAADAPWVSMVPASGRSPVQANLCAVAGSLGAGQHAASVTVSAAVPNSPQTVGVRFTVTPAPALPSGGVVSAASFAANQAVSAGQMLSLFGSHLAAETAQAAGFPLPTELAGTRVLISGVAAPLLYVSPGQINLVAPNQLRNLAGSGTTLTVYTGRLATTPARLNVARSSPGIFTVLGTGAGAGAITHADGSLVSRQEPLRPGEAISVYLTGIGPLEPAVPDGEAAPAEPLARAAGSVRLLLDSQPVEVLYAGASPGFAGLHLVVARVPATLPRRFPEITVESEGVRSNRATAGGPSLLDATPRAVPSNTDATVTLRGLNLPASPAVRIGGETLAGTLVDGELQSVRVTIPGRLLSARGTVSLTVSDPAAASEPASNGVALIVE